MKKYKVEKVKFGIIGCGYIANRHAQHIMAHPEGELVSAYDIIPKKGIAFCKKHQLQYSESINQLLEKDIDIISVCTPNGMHYEGAMAALDSGKHVIVEKPMALKREHCEDMAQAAMQNSKSLFVVKQNRYNPPVAAVKKLIDEKKLGKVYAVMVNCFWNRNEAYYKNSDWKGKKELDGGTLFTQFSHFVDIFYYLFGDITDINGIVSNVNHHKLIDFEDTGSFHFKFKNGALGNLNYTTSCYEQNMEGSITIFAENATIKIGGQYLNSLDYQKTADFDITDLPESGEANDYGYYKGSMSNHDKMIGNVVDTLKGRSKIMTNAIEGMKVVDIIERMYNSARWIP